LQKFANEDEITLRYLPIWIRPTGSLMNFGFDEEDMKTFRIINISKRTPYGT